MKFMMIYGAGVRRHFKARPEEERFFMQRIISKNEKIFFGNQSRMSIANLLKLLEKQFSEIGGNQREEKRRRHEKKIMLIIKK